MPAHEISYIIVEDDRDFVFLIEQLLEKEHDLVLLGRAGTKDEAIRLACALEPDIVLLDLNLSSSGMDGIEAAREIRKKTQSKIIVLTSFEDQAMVIEASKKCFASEYVFKSQFDLIPDVIRKTAAGHTPQEYMIRSLILAELTAAERSVFDAMLGRNVPILSSHKTIANQKTSVFKKLGVKNQAELIHIFGDAACETTQI